MKIINSILSLLGIKKKQGEVTRKNIAYIVRLVESELDVSLIGSSTKQSVLIRRILVNFLLEETGWSVTELSRVMIENGISGQGFSRRALSWYKTTQEEILSGSSYAAIVYAHNYRVVSSLIKSSI